MRTMRKRIVLLTIHSQRYSLAVRVGFFRADGSKFRVSGVCLRV